MWTERCLRDLETPLLYRVPDFPGVEAGRFLKAARMEENSLLEISTTLESVSSSSSLPFSISGIVPVRAPRIDARVNADPLFFVRVCGGGSNGPFVADDAQCGVSKWAQDQLRCGVKR